MYKINWYQNKDAQFANKNDYLCTNNMKKIDEWNRNSVSIA